MPTPAKVATMPKKKCGKKGWIRKGGKGGKKIIIIIDGVTYFVHIKALKEILDGTKDLKPIWGY